MDKKRPIEPEPDAPRKRGRRPGVASPEIATTYSLMVSLAASGVRNREIAERTGLSERTVRRVLAAEGARASTLLEKSPREVIEAWLAGCERSDRAYTELACAPDASARDRIAALAARDQNAWKVIRLLAQLHVLPRDLSTYRLTLNFQRLAHDIVSTLEAVEAGDAKLTDAMEYFRTIGRVGERDGPAIRTDGSVAVETPASAREAVA